MEAKLKLAAMLVFVAPAILAGCSRDRRYESAVQIVRKEAIEKADDGSIETLDFEMEWDACPGDQYQVVRGGKDFAKCADKYNVGDFVPVIVKHYWDPRGYYRWDIEKVGDCDHAIQPDSQGSYEKSQECHDVQQYGRTVGFSCTRRPFKDLVARCPFLARQ